MKNFKNHTRVTLSVLALFFISNSSFAAVTSSNQSGGFSNTTVFYLLIALAIIQIIGVLFLSNSIKDLIKSDFYKKKIFEQEKKKTNGKNIITTLIILIALPFASFSLSPAETSSVVSASDIPLSWVWYMVIINLILLAVVFYVRNLFYQILRTVKKKKVKENKGEEEFAAAKIAKILTDVVPIEREHEIMMDHEYDGIYELDNNLPPWWVWSFYVCIAFAIVYILNYHVIGSGDLQIAEYKKEIEKGDLEVAEYLKSQKLNVDESTVVLLTESSDLSRGKAIFDEKCVACHGKQGEGVIGPNLTDDYWINGGDIKSVFKIIKYGNKNGMQSWKDELNPVEMQQVASFIKSIKGTAIGIGQEPQGELYEESEITTAVSDSTASGDTTSI